MITIQQAGKSVIDTLRQRQQSADGQVTQTVSDIIEQVRQRGDGAVREYTRQFDGVDTDLIPLNRAAIQKLSADCDPAVYAALERAAGNIRDFHARQLQQSWLTTRPDGSFCGQRIRGLFRVGLYVPGGTAAYPSSVLMCAIPAKIAGVGELIMVTPPPKDDGGINPAVMAAAYIAGVDRVYLCGGAQAIAALAYGTETVPRVDKIVGPGNIYVATAKRLVYGLVDIDMVAGPSEILIIADSGCNPAFVAADMLSQAEHDPLASAILLTDSKTVAKAVAAELEKQLAALPRAEIAARSLADYGLILLCASMDEAVDFANALAPEHLEVLCREPMNYLGRLDNAGSIFLGPYAPEPLGDYYAGPNHVLPTGGTARFYSPLSVESFVKKTAFISYSCAALEGAKEDIVTLAQAEGLDAHARAAAIRFNVQCTMYNVQ